MSCLENVRYRELGLEHEARGVFEHLAADHFAGIPRDALWASCVAYLGLLAATMSHWEEAAAHFQDALEVNARMGARPGLAHTQHEYAQLLLTLSNSAGTLPQAHSYREQAMALLDESRHISRQLGMRALEERVISSVCAR
jgi:tetratricopeptide (TPR) repeat protein